MSDAAAQSAASQGARDGSLSTIVLMRRQGSGPAATMATATPDHTRPAMTPCRASHAAGTSPGTQGSAHANAPKSGTVRARDQRKPEHQRRKDDGQDPQHPPGRQHAHA